MGKIKAYSKTDSFLYDVALNGGTSAIHTGIFMPEFSSMAYTILLPVTDFTAVAGTTIDLFANDAVAGFSYQIINNAWGTNSDFTDYNKFTWGFFQAVGAGIPIAKLYSIPAGSATAEDLTKINTPKEIVINITGTLHTGRILFEFHYNVNLF